MDHPPDRLDHLVAAHPLQAGEIEPLDQSAVDPALDLLEVVRAGPDAGAFARRAGRRLGGARMEVEPGCAAAGGFSQGSRTFGPGAGPGGTEFGFAVMLSLLRALGPTAEQRGKRRKRPPRSPLPRMPVTCAPSPFMSRLNFELPFRTMGLPVLMERLTSS